MIDLHTHTNASDGLLSPEELVEFSIKNGLHSIAITDHDTLGGVQRAIDYAKGRTLEIIPGIEIGCDESSIGFKEVHVVGLFINHKDKNLVKLTEKIKKNRISQKKKIIDCLQKLGFEVTFEEIIKNVGSSFGRPHIAKVLVEKYPDRFSSIKDVFKDYLGAGKPAYVERKDKYTIKQAVCLIRSAGGIPILAHPGIFKKEDSVHLVKLFRKAGGEGIETYYPYHIIIRDVVKNAQENQQIILFYKKLAGSLNLLESGGSDFHGGDRNTLKDVAVPDVVLTELKKHLLDK